MVEHRSTSLEASERFLRSAVTASWYKFNARLSKLSSFAAICVSLYACSDPTAVIDVATIASRPRLARRYSFHEEPAQEKLLVVTNASKNRSKYRTFLRTQSGAAVELDNMSPGVKCLPFSIRIVPTCAGRYVQYWPRRMHLAQGRRPEHCLSVSSRSGLITPMTNLDVSRNTLYASATTASWIVRP